MSNPSNNKPRRRRFQFGLSTLLLLMTICAGVAWLWRPQPPETVESSGLRIQAFRRTVERRAVGGKGFSQKQPEQVWQQEVLHGPVRLRDSFGRVLLYGQCDEGAPIGVWKFYHADGRTAQRVELAERAELAGGRFDGRLAAFDARGVKRIELTLRGGAGQELTWPNDPLGLNAPLAPLREGTVRTWWQNGQLRHQGQFAGDVASGEWTFYDEAGKLLAKGRFARGLRSGVWEESVALRNAKGGSTATSAERKAITRTLYAAGIPIDEPEKRLAAAETQLNSDNTRLQLAALHELGRLGPYGRPRLTKILAGTEELLAVAALQALAEFSSDDAPIATIARLAETSSEPRLREAALVALVDLDPAARVESFRTLLLDAQARKGEARLQALRALRGITLRHLAACEKLLYDDDAAVRYAAIWLLVDCVEQLRAQDDSGRPHSDAAVATLKAIAQRAAKSQDPWVKKAAVEVLIWVDAPPARIGVPVVG